MAAGARVTPRWTDETPMSRDFPSFFFIPSPFVSLFVVFIESSLIYDAVFLPFKFSMSTEAATAASPGPAHTKIHTHTHTHARFVFMQMIFFYSTDYRQRGRQLESLIFRRWWGALRRKCLK